MFKEPSLLSEHNISLNDIFEEYKVIRDKISEILDEIYDFEDKIIIEVEKTSCKSDIYYNGKKCIKDNIMIIIYPLVNNFNLMNENFIEYNNDYDFISYELYFSMTIIDNDNNYFKWKINIIIIVKILKLFFFFFVALIFFIFLYFIFIQIFFEYQLNTINHIIQIINYCSLFGIKDKNEIIQKKEKLSIKTNNKEMIEIKNLFDYLIKT